MTTNVILRKPLGDDLAFALYTLPINPTPVHQPVPLRGVLVWHGFTSHTTMPAEIIIASKLVISRS